MWTLDRASTDPPQTLNHKKSNWQIDCWQQGVYIHGSQPIVIVSQQSIATLLVECTNSPESHTLWDPSPRKIPIPYRKISGSPWNWAEGRVTESAANLHIMYISEHIYIYIHILYFNMFISYTVLLYQIILYDIYILYCNISYLIFYDCIRLYYMIYRISYYIMLN